MDLSVILPIHDEIENLGPVIAELRTTLRARGCTFEILAIDDGSRDGSGRELDRLAGEIPELTVRKFRINRGQASAFDAGFRLARGAVVVTMDADGQNDPADIPRLVDAINAGADFVTGRRARRRDGFWFKRLPSRLANVLIRKVTGTTVRDLGCSLKAYRLEIARELLLYGEMHRFISVLVEANGARVVEIDVNHRPRERGRSKYGLARTFKVLMDLITIWFLLNYQSKPIYVFGGLSLASLGGAGGVFGYVLYEKYGLGVFVHRNPLFLIGIVLSVFAVQFLVFGLFAEVLMRTYYESQNKRPYAFSGVGRD